MKRALSLVLALCTLALDAAAQAETLPTEGVTPRDSVREQAAARAEQSRFERIRRNHLPWTWAGGGGDCDERIGRFCLTHDDGPEDEWTPPPEAEEIVRARDRLIARLEEASRRIPGDSWVAGQRIRYLVEARRFQEARAAATECRAAAWWCAALAGYVHHNWGDAGPADSAFTEMLRGMPERERREWTDLSIILEGRARSNYRRMDDTTRARFEERFWGLADPFHMREGNDLRSEHLSRNLLDRLQDRAKSTEGISWGDDLRQILIRYGWPAGWERVRPHDPRMSLSVSLVSHYSSAQQVLLPPPELLVDAEDLSVGEWDVEDRRARTGYNLRAAGESVKWFNPLDHQVAVFRRGESGVVVAAYQIPEDSLPAGSPVDAGLVLLPGVAAPRLIARRPEAGTWAALTHPVGPGKLLLSLEVFAEEARRAGRARFGIEVPPLPAGELGVSDLLLLRSPDQLPDSLPDAVADARGSQRVRAGESLGIFWEIYGLSAADPGQLVLSMRLLERDKSALRRLAERIGVVRELDPIRIRWQEQTGGGDSAARAAVLPRALAVQVPPELDGGAYALELTVRAPGRDPIVVEREIEVVP